MLEEEMVVLRAHIRRQRVDKTPETDVLDRDISNLRLNATSACFRDKAVSDSPLAGAAPRASPRGQKGDVLLTESLERMEGLLLLRRARSRCLQDVFVRYLWLCRFCPPSFSRVGRRGEPAAAPP